MRAELLPCFPCVIKGVLVAALALASIMNAALAAPPPTPDFTVAPNGNDASPGTPDQPFRTLERARDAVRTKIAAGLDHDLLVVLRGGRYDLASPFILGPDDSGTDQHSITYAAYPGERPQISGGQRITGWKKGDGELFTTTVLGAEQGGADFRQLFINGQRRQRARTPNAGFFHVDGMISLDKQARFKPENGSILPAWANRGDVEVIALQSWAEFRMPIREVTEGGFNYVPGVAGTAVSFDGASTYAEVPHSPDLDPEQLTVSAWVKMDARPTSGDPRRWIVNKNGNEWDEGHYALVVDGDRAGAYLNVGGGQQNMFDAWSAPGQFTLGKWHQLGMTYDGKTLHFYLDGAASGEKEINRKRTPGSTPIAIGRRQDGYNYTPASIDEVRIYDRALTPEEMKALGEIPGMNPLPAGLETGLAAHWEFDEGKGSQVRDESGRGHTAAGAGETVVLAGTPAQSNREGSARYWVENAIEALDAPGEWYLDRKTRVLSYWPLPGEEPAGEEVMAPRLTELVRIDGNPGAGKPVLNVHFSGLEFAYSDWTLPETGYTDMQAAYDIPGAIRAVGAVGCSLDHCIIHHVGRYGVEFGRGCKKNRMSYCDLTDLGAGGIKIGEPEIRPLEADIASDNVVSDCHIHDIGIVYPAAVGVWIGQSHGNRIEHNEINDTNYTGISIGWTWGYGPTNARDNLVEYNNVHDIARGMLGDLGGIYCLGMQPGTMIRNNIFHDIQCYEHSYGGWGIYTDEGSSHILVEKNLVYNTRSGGFHQHYGQENILRNNIFAFAKDAQLIRTRQEPHQSFTFERNIVLWDSGGLFGSNWGDGHFKLDNNLYWHIGGGQVRFPSGTLADWQKSGQDQHSIIADPLFKDPAKRDFHLMAGSPAETIGFEPLDLDSVGPRPD